VILWDGGTTISKRGNHCRGAKVSSVPTQLPAASRARWLADVSRALDDARLILTSLSLVEEDYGLAMDLHVRIEAARFEVRSLRLSRSLQPSEEISPNWTEFPLE
jgi:hypothetical protein